MARPPVAAIGVELTLRRQDVLLKATCASDHSPAIDLGESSVAPKSRERTKSQLASLERLAPPPELPMAFQPRSEALEASGLPNNPEARASPGAAGRFARPRSYRLRDGDTLEKLAERFLGSRERADEIYQANRQALVRPDLLPVGTTITIPSREATSRTSAAATDLTPASRGL